MSYCPEPLSIDTSTGHLVIDGIDMHTHAWTMLSLVDLWMPANVRGADKVLPGVPGVNAKRRRRTVTERALPMVIGNVKPDGTPYADASGFEALELNIIYLRQYVADPTNIGDGTRTAVLTRPSGTVRTGKVTVLGIERGATSTTGIMNANLLLSIPGGVL